MSKINEGLRFIADELIDVMVQVGVDPTNEAEVQQFLNGLALTKKIKMIILSEEDE